MNCSFKIVNCKFRWWDPLISGHIETWSEICLGCCKAVVTTARSLESEPKIEFACGSFVYDCKMWPSASWNPYKMGENSSLFYDVNKININKNKLNLGMLDRGKSERSTGVFLFGFGWELRPSWVHRKVRDLCHSSCSILVLLMLSCLNWYPCVCICTWSVSPGMEN